MSTAATLSHGSGASGDALGPTASGLLGAHLRQAELAVAARKAELLKPLGLTVAQYGALALLLGGASKSCSRLAREAHVTSQTMTGVVGNLEAKGFVERRSSPDHARVHLVTLTAEGLDLTMRAEHVVRAVEDDLVGALPAGDAQQLVALLNRVAAAAPRAGGG